VPRFTAEAAVYPVSNLYAATSDRRASNLAVRPQGGTDAYCLSRLLCCARGNSQCCLDVRRNCGPIGPIMPD
jgi:hypothetical protein